MDNVTNKKVTVSSRIITQLGEQLISDEIIALFELIKNSYDADARHVSVNINTNCITEYGNGKIEITDDGNGMTRSIIENAFLRISSDFKVKHKFSPYFKRYCLGNKGLGRLSFQRLGSFMIVTTTPRVDRLLKNAIISNEDYLGDKNSTNQVKLNWSILDNDIDINDVYAEVSSYEQENNVAGTHIQILGIKNLQFWKLDVKKQKRLKQELFAMFRMVYSDPNNRFKVTLNINGTLFETLEVNDKLLSSFSSVKCDFKYSAGKLYLSFIQRGKYIESLAKRQITAMAARGYNLVAPRPLFHDIVQNIEIDLLNMENVRLQFPYLGKIELSEIEGVFADPGEFFGSIYASDLSTDEAYSYLDTIKQDIDLRSIQTINELRETWEIIRGIYLYKNNFRIQPYGKSDWLGFTNFSQRVKNNIFKEHTVSGSITIQKDDHLLEQTNRVGLVEDEYGTNFFKIIRDILAVLLSRKDVELREGYTVDVSKLADVDEINSYNGVLCYKKVASPEKKEVIYKKLETFSTVSIPIATMAETVRASVSTLKNIDDDERKEQNNRISQLIAQRDKLARLMPLAGQGLVIEALTHELHKVVNTIKNNAMESRNIVLKYSTEDLIQAANQLQMILDQNVFLLEQLAHLEPTYTKNRKDISMISLNGFLQSLYTESGPMLRSAKRIGAKVMISGDNLTVRLNKGLFITIIDNLFINALYWLETSKTEREIHFDINEPGKSLKVWDTGPGIHPDIEDKLFMPFESMKEDGRGLGLFIAKELILSMGGDILLLPDRKNGRRYIFEIKFA